MLLQPGSSATGRFTVQGHKAAQQTRRVKAWIWHKGFGELWPPQAIMILNKAVRTAPSQFKTLKVEVENIPAGVYRLKIEVVGNKQFREENAGLYVIPHTIIPATAEEGIEESEVEVDEVETE